MSVAQTAMPVEVRDRVGAMLAAEGLDAVLTVSSEGSKYLSGAPLPFQIFFAKRPTAVLWPRDGEPVLFTGHDQLAGPRRSSWIADLRGYREHGRTTAEVLGAMLGAMLGDLLAERELEDARVGYEDLLMPTAVHRAIVAAAPGVELVPVDGALDRVRATKTAAEIAVISAVARMSELGVRDAFSAARAGWTERELAARITARIVERGAETVPMILVGTGEGARVFGEPTDRRLAPGDLVRVDLNAYLGGYYSDLGRMAVVGAPSAAQADAYAKHVELNRRLLPVMRPGTTCAEVFAAEQRIAEELGAELLEQPSIGLGHAIGTHPNDAPKLMPGDDTVLERGMVLVIEPDVIGPLGERLHLEQMVLVQDEGARLLTGHADWSALPVIPLD